MHLSNRNRTESKLKRYLSPVNLLFWGFFWLFMMWVGAPGSCGLLEIPSQLYYFGLWSTDTAQDKTLNLIDSKIQWHTLNTAPPPEKKKKKKNSHIICQEYWKIGPVDQVLWFLILSNPPAALWKLCWCGWRHLSVSPYIADGLALLSSHVFKLIVTNELLRSHQTVSRSRSCQNLTASPLTTPFSSHVSNGLIGASE